MTVILGVPSRPGLRVMVASKSIDFRRGMDGLVALMMQVLAADQSAGDVFVFRAKRGDWINLILWERLEVGNFTWPPVQDGVVMLSVPQLRMLFFGIDWTQIPARSAPPSRPSMPAENLQAFA